MAHAAELGAAHDIQLPLVRLVLGMIVCIAIAIFAILWLKRSAGLGVPTFAKLGRNWPRLPDRQIVVIETRRLSTHADICRFACHEHEYLVVLSSNGATLLCKTSAGGDSDPAIAQ